MLPESWIVLGVVRLSGRCEAFEYIKGLDARYRAKYQRFFERLRDGQPIKSPENFRRIGDTKPDVFELKADKYRVYLVRHGNCWYVTHGRNKPTNSQVPTEVKKSLEIFWERGAR